MLLLLLTAWLSVPGPAKAFLDTWDGTLESNASQIAAGGGDPLPDPSPLTQYGPGGVLAAVILGLCLYLLRIERERNTRLESDLRDLNKQFRDQLVPLLGQFTSEATRLTQATTEAIRAMSQQQGGR